MMDTSPPRRATGCPACGEETSVSPKRRHKLLPAGLLLSLLVGMVVVPAVLSLGAHSIRASFVDNAGRRTSRWINVTVTP